MSRRLPIVAIDGPAGAGKSTAARRVAEALGFRYLDTGALYRAVAVAAKQAGVAWSDGPALGRLAAAVRIEFAGDPLRPERRALLIDGVDRTEAIRTPEMSLGASAVSKHCEVRAALLGVQRALGKDGGAVAEGRDIGTVVFPDAEVKVFLSASPEVRARRRYEELRAKGERVEFEQTLAETLARDRQDSTREVAPLVAAPDAVLLDSTSRSADEVVAAIVALARAKGG